MSDLRSPKSTAGAVDAETAEYVARLKDDLEASLRFVLGIHFAKVESDAQVISEGIVKPRDGQWALLTVRTLFGIPVYGQVLLFHLENKTELLHDAEVLSSSQELARVGMKIVDLDWPNESLNPIYWVGDAPVETDSEIAGNPVKTDVAPVPVATPVPAPSKFDQDRDAVFSSLDTMLHAERDWDELPPSLRALDEPAMRWIAAALVSEGIGKLN